MADRTCIDEADPATLLSVLSALNTQGCMVDENLASTSAAHIEGGQVWVGSYLCSQGDTDLQLEITEVDSDGNVAAVFDCKCSSFVGFSTSLNRSFCPVDHTAEEAGGRSCGGRYTVSGKLQGDGSLHLAPDQAGSSTEGWLENPCNYFSVGLVGTVSLRDGELSYSGTIENPSCGAFLVTLPASGSAHGHLSCPEGDTDWLLGPTQCYVSHAEAMTLEDATEHCRGLDPRAVVAKVPTMDDLAFIMAQIPDDDDSRAHSYLLGATCPATDKTFCDFLDGTPVTITPRGYCELRLNPAERQAGCGEPDDIQENMQLGVNKNGLFDGSLHARKPP